jgi:hypothetical protein
VSNVIKRKIMNGKLQHEWRTRTWGPTGRLDYGTGTCVTPPPDCSTTIHAELVLPSQRLLHKIWRAVVDHQLSVVGSHVVSDRVHRRRGPMSGHGLQNQATDIHGYSYRTTELPKGLRQ